MHTQRERQKESHKYSALRFNKIFDSRTKDHLNSNGINEANAFDTSVECEHFIECLPLANDFFHFISIRVFDKCNNRLMKNHRSSSSSLRRFCVVHYVVNFCGRFRFEFHFEWHSEKKRAQTKKINCNKEKTDSLVVVFLRFAFTSQPQVFQSIANNCFYSSQMDIDEYDYKRHCYLYTKPLNLLAAQ